MDAVAEPQLLRKRRAPAWQEVGDSGTHYFPSTPKEYFHHMYYGVSVKRGLGVGVFFLFCFFYFNFFFPFWVSVKRGLGVGVGVGVSFF